MIKIYSDEEIKLIKESGHITYMCHQHMKEFIKPGVTTKFLDDVSMESVLIDSLRKAIL